MWPNAKQDKWVGELPRTKYSALACIDKLLSRFCLLIVIEFRAEAMVRKYGHIPTTEQAIIAFFFFFRYLSFISRITFCYIFFFFSIWLFIVFVFFLCGNLISGMTAGKMFYSSLSGHVWTVTFLRRRPDESFVAEE